MKTNNKLFFILAIAIIVSSGLTSFAQEDLGSANSLSSPEGMSADSFPDGSDVPQDIGQDSGAQPRRVPRGKNPKTLKIDFEDQLIKGKHDMPEAEFIFTRTQFNYKKMIKLRDNFVPEVKQGKDEFRGRN